MLRWLVVLFVLMVVLPTLLFADMKTVKVSGSGQSASGWMNLNESTQQEAEESKESKVGTNVDVAAEYLVTGSLNVGIKSDGDKTDIMLFRRWKF